MDVTCSISTESAFIAIIAFIYTILVNEQHENVNSAIWKIAMSGWILKNDSSRSRMKKKFTKWDHILSVITFNGKTTSLVWRLSFAYIFACNRYDRILGHPTLFLLLLLLILYFFFACDLLALQWALVLVLSETVTILPQICEKLASHDVHSVSNKSKLMRFWKWTKC